MAEEKDKKEKKEEPKSTGSAKATWKKKAAIILTGIAVIFLLFARPEWSSSPSSTPNESHIDPRDVGVVYVTTEYGALIEADPDQYVHFQTIDTVDLECAYNGFPAQRITSGRSENLLPPGFNVGPRTNCTYRICGGNVTQTTMYYVKYRGTRPQGWYEAALKKQ